MAQESKPEGGKSRKPLTRELTVEEAIKWLSSRAHPRDGRQWRRVIIAVRDPADEHAYLSLSLNEAL